MEANSKKDFFNESGFPRFDNEQKEEGVEIIGDILNEEREKDENLHNAELYNASVEIATLLSGSAVFFSGRYSDQDVSERQQRWRRYGTGS